MESESVLGIWFMGWMGLMGAGGGEELVWTDHGVPKPGREGELDPPLALCISWVGLGNAALRPPDNMLAVLLPLPLWWAMGESIWIDFTEVGDGDAASASASSREESAQSRVSVFSSGGLTPGCRWVL